MTDYCKYWNKWDDANRVENRSLYEGGERMSTRGLFKAGIKIGAGVAIGKEIGEILVAIVCKSIVTIADKKTGNTEN